MFMKKKVSADKELHGQSGASSDVEVKGVTESGPAARDEVQLQLSRIPELEAEIASKQSEIERYREELLRKAAEFENFRKVKERESVAAGARALESTIRGLLPLLDDLKRVVRNAPGVLEITAEAKPYVDGVELLKRSFDNWLAEKGVSEIEAVGRKLDVNFHEAISMIDVPDTEPETIVEEYQSGYLLGDRVLRHARVIVAK